MFCLKVSSFLKRINEVKMHIGLPPSKDGSRLEGNAPCDRSEETTSAVKEEVDSKSEAVDKLYKLEMDERGRSLSFTWALNSKGNVKHTPIGARFKRARTNNLSSSIANYEPLQRPGRGKLKFIGDPTLRRRETPEPQRIHEANSNEEEDAGNSTSGRNPSRPKSTSQCRGRDTSKGREDCSSESGGFGEDDNANQANAELCDKPSSSTGTPHINRMFSGRPGTENSEQVLCRENFACKTDSSFRQVIRSRQPSGAKTKPHKSFPSGAVLLCKNEAEQESKDAASARQSQDIVPVSKRKRSSHSARHPETGDRKPGIFKAVKIEPLGVKQVNTEEDEDWNFPSGSRCILGLRPESKDLILLEPVSHTIRSQHITSATDRFESKDLILMEPVSHAIRSQHITSAADIQFRGRSAGEADDNAPLDRSEDIGQEEERGDHSDTPKVEFPNKDESGTGASPQDANADQLLLLETDCSSLKQTGTTKCELTICDTNLEVKANCLVGDRLFCKDELANGLKIAAPTTKRVGDIDETGPSKTHRPNEERQIALGVTEGDLIEAFIDHGVLVSIRAADLVSKFRHRLKTLKANDAFLQLLKRNCKPKKKNGELYLEFRTC